MRDKRLPGAEKYLAGSDDRARFEEQDALVARANEITDLRLMLNELDCDIPEDTVGSWKARCPWGAEHEDGGIDKAMRYYPESNSAFCFATHGMLTPVRLVSMAEGISQHKSAQRLMGSAGIKYGWRDRFHEMQAASSPYVTATPAYAFSALQVRLRAYPAYMERQYDSDFRAALEARMDVLGATPGSFDSYMAWVEESVAALAPLLNG